VSRGQRGGSLTAVHLRFLDRSLYFSFKYLLVYSQDAEWTPFKKHCYSENLVEPGIEPGIFGFAARNLTTRHKSGRDANNVSECSAASAQARRRTT
jgi:hypothetical protein